MYVHVWQSDAWLRTPSQKHGRVSSPDTLASAFLRTSASPGNKVVAKIEVVKVQKRELERKDDDDEATGTRVRHIKTRDTVKKEMREKRKRTLVLYTSD